MHDKHDSTQDETALAIGMDKGPVLRAAQQLQ